MDIEIVSISFYKYNGMMKRALVGFILVATLAAFSSFETDLPKSAWKKIEKEWSKQWPDQNIKKEEIHISNDINVGFEIKDVDYTLYHLSSDSSRIGYMMISKAFGRYDFFDYMVLYNSDLTIKSTKVLIYREDWGGEIASTRWLKQFIGLSSKDQIALDHDIQGISGATISCRSAVIGVKQLTDIMSKLNDKSLLD